MAEVPRGREPLVWDTIRDRQFARFACIDDFAHDLAQQQPYSNFLSDAYQRVFEAEAALDRAKEDFEVAKGREWEVNKDRLLDEMPTKIFEQCRDMDIENCLLRKEIKALEDERNELQTTVDRVKDALTCPTSHVPLYHATTYIVQDGVVDAAGLSDTGFHAFVRHRLESNEVATPPFVHVYDRSSIEKWTGEYGRSTDPVTRLNYSFAVLPCKVPLVCHLTQLVFGQETTDLRDGAPPASPPREVYSPTSVQTNDD